MVPKYVVVKPRLGTAHATVGGRSPTDSEDVQNGTTEVSHCACRCLEHDFSGYLVLNGVSNNTGMRWTVG